ncbi:MAG: hypothetical protein II264_06670, partial [Ruminococcus sp.]|nr:hypothetical protein [Ruminococcus sp.]
MKKIMALLLTAILTLGAFSAVPVSAADSGKPTGFTTDAALFVHAVLGSDDGEAWQRWQCVHDEDFNEISSDEKYFFLPSSANGDTIDVFNGFDGSVTVNGVDIASQTTAEVPYSMDESYSVSADGKDYTLRVMKSGAEAAIYINNSDADGEGTDLMS